VGLQKNAARLFLLAPVMTLLVLLTSYGGRSSPLWDVIMGGLDGYALYCFFAFLVLGCGGEEVLEKRLEPEDGGTLTIRLLFCIPLRFRTPSAAMTFLRRSVLQCVVLRPLLIALGALCGLSAHGANLIRLFRTLAVLDLVYAVIIIGRVRRQLWS
jgi:hypothetical protein